MPRNNKELTRRLVVPVIILFSFSQIFAVFPVAAATQFTFVAAGDYGLNGGAVNVMSSMHSLNPNFALGVGDFMYTTPSSSLNEQIWCSTFKSYVQNVELVVGNHETLETNTTDGGGSINKFVKDCPFTLGSMTGTYGFQYYFDYPSTSPLARFIMVDPGIWSGATGSTAVSYASGTANFNWVSNAIDSARASGIQWIVVGMHKICIGTGTTGCEVQPSLMTMLMNKRVDLILQAHDHTYQRTKQLTCEVDGTYNSSCVANAGSSFNKGAGSVIVIDGTGGEGGGRTVSSDVDNGYFAAYCCSNGTPLGYSVFTVTTNSLQSRFVNTSGGQTYQGDSFSIGAPSSFGLTANPASLSFVSGHNANTKITATSLGGFTGTVTFSAKVSPSIGLTATIGPLSINLPNGGMADTQLAVSSRIAGVYAVNITGVSGSFSTSVIVTVKVSDYSVSAQPTSVRFTPKTSGSSTITVQSLEGFTGGVNVNAQSTPGGIGFSFNHGGVNLVANGNASWIMKMTSGNIGKYNVTVTASGAGLNHSIFLTVIVSNTISTDFTVTAAPTQVSFNAGATGSTKITATGVSGFQGSLSITSSVNPSNGLVVSCNPSSINLTPTTTSGSSNCTMTSAAAGSYTVTLVASNGTLSRSAVVSVNVEDFSISVSPSTVNGQVGPSATATITMSSLGQFSGTVSLGETVSSSTVTASVSSSSVQLASGISVSATLTLSASAAGNYSVQVVATSGSLSHSTTLAFIVAKTPDFAIAANPTQVSVTAGTSGTSILTVIGLNGFTGSVSLTAAVSGGSSSNLSCLLSPASVSLSSSSSNSTLSCSASSTASGTFIVTTTGASGSLSHSVSVAYNVGAAPDFTINASPSIVPVTAGIVGTSTIGVASLNSFNNTVNLTDSISPSVGLTCSLNPTSVTPPNGGSANSTLSCMGSVSGIFTVTVTGTSGSSSHTATVTYNIAGAPDFSLNVNPSALAINVGIAGNSSITVSSLNGFNTQVNLIESVSPSAGIACGVNPASLTPAAGGSASSILSCIGTVAGSFTVTVTGTSGSMSHSVNIVFTVTAVTSSSSYALVTTFEGQVYKDQNGTLTLIGQPVTTALRLIGWKPDGSYALIVGDSATLLKWNGTTLTSISTVGVMSAGDDLNAIAWKPDGSYALLGGTDGDLLKWDATTQTLSRITDSNTHQIQGISWDPTGTTAMLVGNGGALFTYQNGVITLLNSGTTNDLYGVSWNPNGGYALISGSNGSILRWDGTTATALNTIGLYPATTIVRYVAWNSAGTQALLVGNAGGLVLSYDGTNLNALSSGTSNGLFSLAWSGNTAIIVGNSGTMLSYSGGSITTLAAGTTSSFRGISWKPV